MRKADIEFHELPKSGRWWWSVTNSRDFGFYYKSEYFESRAAALRDAHEFLRYKKLEMGRITLL